MKKLQSVVVMMVCTVLMIGCGFSNDKEKNEVKISKQQVKQVDNGKKENEKKSEVEKETKETPKKEEQKIDITGTWQGVLDVSGKKLRLEFVIGEENGVYNAYMNSLDQGANHIEADTVSFIDREIKVMMMLIAGTYEGRINDEGTKITGLWSQGGVEYILDLEKGLFDEIKSAHYEKEVVIENEKANLSLAGTLLLPEEKGIFPLAIFITGSGAQDRNETIMGHQPFRVISEHLASKGIASYRFDDRGVGASTGDFSMATSEDFASDVDAVVTHFLQYENIDKEQIVLIGHSEGGMIAPMVATMNEEVDALVLLAGTGVSGGEIIAKQVETIIMNTPGIEEKVRKDQIELQFQIIELVREYETEEKFEKDIREVFEKTFKDYTMEEKNLYGYTEENLEAQIKTLASPWYRFFVTYDPSEALEQITIPVLALNGTKDVQVDAKQNLTAIEESLQKAGNDKVTVIELEGLNHLFQTAKTGLPKEYATIEETIAPKVLEIISDWIRKETK